MVGGGGYIDFTPYFCQNVWSAIPHYAHGICGTNTTQGGMMCHILFPAKQVKVKLTWVIRISIVRVGDSSRSLIYNF